MKTLKFTLTLILLACFGFAFSQTKPAVSKNNIGFKEIQYNVELANLWGDLETSSITKVSSSMIKTIFDQFLSGKVKAYCLSDFKRVLTPKEFLAQNERIDSVTMVNPLKPEKDTLMIIKAGFNPDECDGICFIEEWKMDQSTLKFEKKVLGFAPVMGVYTTNPATGNLVFKGWRPAFFVKNQ